jgi:hypothetical protein
VKFGLMVILGKEMSGLFKASLNKLSPLMVRQNHHEWDQQLTVGSEPDRSSLPKGVISVSLTTLKSYVFARKHD